LKVYSNKLKISVLQLFTYFTQAQKLFTLLFKLVLSYGRETWTIRADKRLISAEMRFPRRTAGYTRWDHKINEDILTELQILQTTEFIYRYRKNWKQHVDRLSSDRIPTIILKYQSKRKRNLGRPLERRKDSVL
jgi:hypothetical protein